MALFKRKALSRGELLAQAAVALGKGRHRQALKLYDRLLELDPNDPEVRARIAPLLAERGRRDEAWESYEHAAEHHRREGFLDRAISLYRQATEKLPREVQAWQRLADLHVEREAHPEAFRTLEAGFGQFGWWRRRERLQLAQNMRILQPDNIHVACLLARLLVRDGRKTQALQLLAEVERGLPAHGLRRVRWLAAFLSPTPAAGWRWFRAVTVGR